MFKLFILDFVKVYEDLFKMMYDRGNLVAGTIEIYIMCVCVCVSVCVSVSVCIKLFNFGLVLKTRQYV